MLSKHLKEPSTFTLLSLVIMWITYMCGSCHAIPGTPREFWGTAVTDWPEAPKGNDAEITALCQRISLYLLAP